jgi:hypothetical protein
MPRAGCLGLCREREADLPGGQLTGVGEADARTAKRAIAAVSVKVFMLDMVRSLLSRACGGEILMLARC